MIDHDRAQELSATALDFALTDADRQDLLVHLDGCPDCRAIDERIRADAHAIARLPALAAPDELRARVLDAAAAPRESEHADERDALAAQPARLGKGDEPRALPVLLARYRLPVAILTSAAVVVALIAGMLFWRSSPDGDLHVAGAGPSSSAPSASGPPIRTGSGSDIAAHDWSAVADLTADDEQGGVVSLASGFRLTSLDGTPAADLAAHLTADPPVRFTVAADSGAKIARITPTEPLTAGTVYRFTLAADDGGTLDSWAFQAHNPVHVIATLPGDTSSGVPTNTGIEVTFDQDGVVGAASHMTIAPKTQGRFEQHGRTLAFVPAKNLAASTIYTVTVSAGVEVGGTGEVLESDVRFKFETAAPGKGEVQTTFQFTDGVYESATSDPPTIAVWVFQESPDGVATPKPPKTARIEVYRLRDLDTAVAAFRQVLAFPRWTRQSGADLVPTKGLDRAVTFDASLHQQDEGYLWFQLPDRLPAGWYVMTVRSGTRPVQAILQVTDIAGYLAVSQTKTLVWANDIASGGPVAGATVALDGADLGRTGADGTRIVDTPAALISSDGAPCTDKCFPVVTVRSGDRATFLPTNGRGQGFEGDGSYPGANEAARYWSTFDTDRTLYRGTDTVNAWGMVRDRDSGTVPASVTIRLFASNGESGVEEGAPLATTEVHPNAVGAFSGSIAINDVSDGDYILESSVANGVVGSAWVRVDRILKPAYRLDVVTGRRVYFQGDQIKVTATATFFEGSPVPGVLLRVDGFVGKTFKTDAAGTASVRTTVRFDDNNRDTNTEPDVRSVTVIPARAEEGAISGASREIVAFPSRFTFDATGLIADGRVQVTGSLHAVDRDRLEREIASGKTSVWELHPSGDPIPGKTVAATFTEQIPYRIETGTHYDFIEKKVVPVYEYGSTDRVAGTIRVTTGNDGTFTASINVSDSDHTYKIRLTATDPDKHQARWVQWVSKPGSVDTGSSSSLVLTSDPTAFGSEFGVGDQVDLTMDPGRPAKGTDRYLFYTAQRGLHEATVQPSARYRGTFADWATPGMRVTGIRFTGRGYTQDATFQASFRKADRELTVGLATNAARYDPGAEVRLTVTTRDHNGRPVPASVILRGVDEKLFTIGAAEPTDPLGQLYQDVPSGILATYRSHHEPTPGSEGGDTTGGGGDGAPGRANFRDWVLFKEVDTGTDGRAVVTFKVSDDLTSWRVSASAFGAGPTAGEATIGIPVGLPFFVDATIAPEYLVVDRPAIGLRAFGTALAAGAPVTFTVDSSSLGMHVKGLHSTAFETATVPLPKLMVGRHPITITATSGSGASARRDVMTRTIDVVSSRLTRTRAEYVEPTAATDFTGGTGRVDVIVSDPGPARYVPLLLGLTDVDSARLERALAASLAGSLMKDRFGLADVVSGTDFDGRTYQTEDGGLAILPYSSSNLEVSALAALVAPDRFDRGRLDAYLSSVSGNGKEMQERRIIALAGLGGLHAPVLPRIREAASAPNLTVRELLMLGLGAAALGDAATARSIGTALETKYGEITSEQARLRVGGTAADIAAGTALMAMLAAANGDPLAGRFWSYVENNPDADATYSLHAVGFVTRLLERRAARTASFAYTIAGKREVVELKAGETFRVSVTHEQFGSLVIEPVVGQIGVTTSWRESVKPSAFAKDPDLTISRRMTPTGNIGTAALVTVDLTVRIGPKAPKGCHLVTDIVPSGLVAVGNLQGWSSPDSEPAPTNVDYPYAQVGQRVSFCADKEANHGLVHLRYFARVVTAGTYAWEPAVVESRSKSGRAALTEATVVTIR